MRSLGFLDQSVGGWSFADNDQHRLFVLGAVIMDLIGGMRDEARGLKRDGRVLVPLIAGTDPPRSRYDRDEAIVRMKMRLSEISRLEFVHHDIKARLGR